MAWAGRRWAEPPRLRRARRSREVRPSGSGLRPDRREGLASSAAARAWRCRAAAVQLRALGPLCTGASGLGSRPGRGYPRSPGMASKPAAALGPMDLVSCPVCRSAVLRPARVRLILTLCAAPAPLPSFASKRQGPAGAIDRSHVLAGKRAGVQLGRLHGIPVILTRRAPSPLSPLRSY